MSRFDEIHNHMLLMMHAYRCDDGKETEGVAWVVAYAEGGRVAGIALMRHPCQFF